MTKKIFIEIFITFVTIVAMAVGIYAITDSKLTSFRLGTKYEPAFNIEVYTKTVYNAKESSSLVFKSANQSEVNYNAHYIDSVTNDTILFKTENLVTDDGIVVLTIVNNENKALQAIINKGAQVEIINANSSAEISVEIGTTNLGLFLFSLQIIDYAPYSISYNLTGCTKITAPTQIENKYIEKEIILQANNVDFTKWTISATGCDSEISYNWVTTQTCAIIKISNTTGNITLTATAEIDYWDGSTEAFADGTGSESDPYLIRNGAQLQNVSSTAGTAGLYYKMMNNIYLNEETLTGESATAQSWTPISDFYGTFNGNGYCVSGMYINLETESSGALFYIVRGVVKNLGVKNTYIKAYLNSGTIAGGSYGTIESCYFEGNIITTSYNNTGGICGMNYGTIRNCYNFGTIVTKAPTIGGIVGHCAKGKVENCYNFGNISIADGGSGEGSAGGITGYAGFNTEGQDAEIINCFNAGNISGRYPVGSIVGRNHPYRNNTIQNCYYLPNTAVDGSGKIQNGIGTLTIGSALADVAGQTATATEANFKSMDWLVNTLGWDPNIWEILPNGGYPTLKVFNK